MKMANSVEAYLKSTGNWQPALEKLRELALSTGATETLKWGIPTYLHKKKQVFGIVAFKQWVTIWFPQGVFLKDPFQVLVNASEGKTKGNRQWRFAEVAFIDDEKVLQYMHEALLIAEAGLEIKPDRNKLVEIPQELQDAMQQNGALASAFEALTKMRKREYAEYISVAKRAETRAARLTKIIPLILDGIGLHDKYR
jgi:uncharacterized protein YdeI (YjbR/CyaY-like superfamily)